MSWQTKWCIGWAIIAAFFLGGAVGDAMAWNEYARTDGLTMDKYREGGGVIVYPLCMNEDCSLTSNDI